MMRLLIVATLLTFPGLLYVAGEGPPEPVVKREAWEGRVVFSANLGMVTGPHVASLRNVAPGNLSVIVRPLGGLTVGPWILHVGAATHEGAPPLKVHTNATQSLPVWVSAGNRGLQGYATYQAIAEWKWKP